MQRIFKLVIIKKAIMLSIMALPFIRKRGWLHFGDQTGWHRHGLA